MFPTHDDFKNQTEKIAVVGLGYVGLPLAACLSHHYQVIGFEVNSQRVAELKSNIDSTGELVTEELQRANIELTSDPARLKGARLIIATVPTPVDRHKRPDLTPVKKASETIGQNLAAGSTVVYESTVYPGVTQDVCVPILEEHSGLKCGPGFKVGYSPERINPGDRKHTLTTIVKVVSGQDRESTDLLAAVYGSIIQAGVYVAPDIKTAEAAKVIENIQRDLNIALMNELALIFNQLGIDTLEVIKAASTKWNFHPFEPGLVGGHCIGVDPYYLTYKAEEIGYHPTVILSGRRVNDQMGKYVAEQAVKRLIEASKNVKGARVLILGLSFKENVSDSRNTRVIDIYQELLDYGVTPYIYDPVVSREEVRREYGLDLVQEIGACSPYDAVILAVKHREFLDYGLDFYEGLSTSPPVLIDVKSVHDKEEALGAGFHYWRL